jgi:Ser/Thr protein kinase RdoA (MazF antagonist)
MSCCFSYEPRITDFARTANRYQRELNEADCALLFEQFQAKARLDREEVDALPLMMCAYDLYYAVMHILLFLEEEGNPEGQAQMIRAIEYEMKSTNLYFSQQV